MDLNYCDKCGKVHNLPIQECKEIIGECQICLRYIGKLNQTDISLKGDEISHSFGSFMVRNLPGFLKGLQAQAVHPDLPYKFMADELVIYFPSMKDDGGRKSIIVSNLKRGEEIQVFIE